MPNNTPNYRQIRVPEDVPPEEYSYSQRRAEILQLIEEAGHPDALNQAQLGRRYEVDRSSICRDFKRLREFLRETIGDHRHAVSATVFRKAIREHVEAGEWSDAIDAVESWNDWLREEGARDTEPEELAVEMSASDRYADLVGQASSDPLSDVEGVAATGPPANGHGDGESDASGGGGDA